MFRYPEASKSFGDVLTDAIILGFASYKLLLPLLPVYLAAVLMLGESQYALQSDLLQGGKGGLHWLYLGLGVVALSAIAVAMLRRVHIAASGDEASIAEVLQYAVARIPVIVICIVGVMLASFAGLLLFIVPGIVIAVSLSLFLTLIATDDAGISSMERSHKLIWPGHWWWTFGLYLLLGVIVFMLMMGVMVAVLPMLGPVPELSPGDLAPPDFARRMNAVTSVLSALMVPFQLGLQLMIVHELKLRRGPKDRPEDFKGLAA